ncbi:DVU0772 family protein [Pseudodesulfovibrio senegalensis]|jgi:hypothetical protein|uniref:Uncharacterized protein n=1 Tax=Pseudodesulfovibrio senegalensis TaxID=1721087 RepID=A0A6N6N879_9BACT|nr:hypothetical protein [Pseudodesulfovibrio senegalensis]KAB1443509.1 hypothetical protein F8A88_04485 [Pseudodesulfovibrio senegalensis]
MGSLREYRNLDIDWNMTPEDAVTMYLEWGNNSWHADHRPVTSKADFSNYFVVYAWDDNPKVMLIRRNSEEARELVVLDLPEKIGRRFLESVSHLKGVYAPNQEVREWLETQMDV